MAKVAQSPLPDSIITISNTVKASHSSKKTYRNNNTCHINEFPLYENEVGAWTWTCLAESERKFARKQICVRWKVLTLPRRQTLKPDHLKPNSWVLKWKSCHVTPEKMRQNVNENSKIRGARISSFFHRVSRAQPLRDKRATRILGSFRTNAIRARHWVWSLKCG